MTRVHDSYWRLGLATQTGDLDLVTSSIRAAGTEVPSAKGQWTKRERETGTGGGVGAGRGGEGGYK